MQRNTAPHTLTLMRSVLRLVECTCALMQVQLLEARPQPRHSKGQFVSTAKPRNPKGQFVPTPKESDKVITHLMGWDLATTRTCNRSAPPPAQDRDTAPAFKHDFEATADWNRLCSISPNLRLRGTWHHRKIHQTGISRLHASSIWRQASQHLPSCQGKFRWL